MNTLCEFDTNITLAINALHNTYFDHFFYIFTQTSTWIPLIAVLIFITYRKYRAYSIIIILLLALAILSADQISSTIIKPLVHRLRPSREPAIADIIHTVNNYRGGLYGFVSSHAANSFAIVTLSALIFKNRYYTLLFALWATLTAYSRVYLGVHYFGDILCGAAIGTAIAILIHSLYRHILNRHIRRRQTKTTCTATTGTSRIEILNTTPTTRQIAAICYTLIFSILIIAIIAAFQ